MKFIITPFLLLLSMGSFSQNLQLLYDFRHTVDPEINSANYPILSFEFFKNVDTTGSGAFMLKLQTDLKGENNNMGQAFMQVTRSIRYWEPNLYLSFNYSGGLGVATPGNYGYSISNSFAVGVSYPFQWNGTWFSSSLFFRYNAFEKPSYDPQLSLYFGTGFFYYKLVVTGGFVFWTQNRNQGDEYTRDLSGKKFAFFGDPQIWYQFYKGVSIGSKINVYYHLMSEKNSVQFYPALGMKFQF